MREGARTFRRHGLTYAAARGLLSFVLAIGALADSINICDRQTPVTKVARTSCEGSYR